MNCCKNKNITCKDYESICINCGTIHDIINMSMKFLLEIII